MPSHLAQFQFPQGYGEAPMTVYQAEGIIASIPGVTDKIVNWFKGEYRQANSSDRLKKEVMMRQMMQYYISALKTTGKDKTTDLEPLVVRILQEALRIQEGSFNWAVIAEPPAKPIYEDFLAAWDAPGDDEPEVVTKPSNPQENAKGKGRETGTPVDETPKHTTRGAKRKLEEEEDAEVEGEEEEEEEEDEEEGEEGEEQKRDEGPKKRLTGATKRVRIKSAAEVNSGDEGGDGGNRSTPKRPHPDGVCQACRNAGQVCLLSVSGRTACDRCNGRKERCSLTKGRGGEKGESTTKGSGEKGESAKKAEPKKSGKKPTLPTKPSSSGLKPSGSKLTGTHLLGEKMTVFSNPNFEGISPIPPKSIGELAGDRGQSEPSVRVRRRRSESVREGSIRPGHDQEIPSISFTGLGVFIAFFIINGIFGAFIAFFIINPV
ncbi:uncharacterized protein LACBIDRAFT_323970 [Laccaria bicolor S238N-H82]|uniref:Predicted protein n=1 Tax=Laccaria bicolor (strain S238N-H82 / ATCC MYA-4686) TaxID=486041 RepID=B0D080_LACBS|nr:uncharacterized protein LACBIDRAFT_323970 [Laccaria bicolor S238N-H82]EDR11407.1 predicted protein [Laccaria bicolor S238N-H82]|eukprot:XP_001877304.1 predicted protein [Laccaria bicolor S238N-H82]